MFNFKRNSNDQSSLVLIYINLQKILPSLNIRFEGQLNKYINTSKEYQSQYFVLHTQLKNRLFYTFIRLFFSMLIKHFHFRQIKFEIKTQKV